MFSLLHLNVDVERRRHTLGIEDGRRSLIQAENERANRSCVGNIYVGMFLLGAQMVAIAECGNLLVDDADRSLTSGRHCGAVGCIGSDRC